MAIRRILGIETSCDETSAAILRLENGRPILDSLVILSQDIHRVFGGVVPELASREHLRTLGPVVDRALAEAGIGATQLDGIAATAGPGLVGALLVGLMYGKGLAYGLRRPFIGVHHMEGHLFAPTIEHPELTPPFVALLVSGGHTMLLDVRGWGNYFLLGETLDDAAGEAFDKTAKLLGLPYPGGPALARLADDGDPSRYPLPRPMIGSDNLDFSFSGLKTAVALACRNTDLDIQARADLAASFQQAVVDVLTAKCVKAMALSGMNTLVVAGGVGANASLRVELDNAGTQHGFGVHYPAIEYCTDNGAMIALAGALRLSKGTGFAQHDGFGVLPRWDLSTT